MGELIPFRNAGGQPPLQSGGGGGRFDDMEARVKRLEDDYADLKGDVKGLRADVGDLKVGLAKLQGEISRLPGYPGMFAIVAAMAGLVALIVRFMPSGPTP